MHPIIICRRVTPSRCKSTRSCLPSWRSPNKPAPSRFSAKPRVFSAVCGEGAISTPLVWRTCGNPGNAGYRLRTRRRDRLWRHSCHSAEYNRVARRASTNRYGTMSALSRSSRFTVNTGGADRDAFGLACRVPADTAQTPRATDSGGRYAAVRFARETTAISFADPTQRTRSPHYGDPPRIDV